MEELKGKLTVYFDIPFWVGVFERISGDELSVCKVTGIAASTRGNENRKKADQQRTTGG